MAKTRSTTPKLNLTMAERLKGLRLAAGLNQTELARLFECSQGTISKLEKGELEPTAFQLSRMRDVFGISVDSFLDDRLDFMSIAGRFSNYRFKVEALYEVFEGLRFRT